MKLIIFIRKYPYFSLDTIYILFTSCPNAGRALPFPRGKGSKGRQGDTRRLFPLGTPFATTRGSAPDGWTVPPLLLGNFSFLCALYFVFQSYPACRNLYCTETVLHFEKALISAELSLMLACELPHSTLHSERIIPHFSVKNH